MAETSPDPRLFAGIRHLLVEFAKFARVPDPERLADAFLAGKS